MDIRIFPPDEILETSIDLPLSKSISARALIINHIGHFDTHVKLSDCSDINVLTKALETDRTEVNVSDSGTAMRFLIALFAATSGKEVVIDGTARLRERPIAPLVNALRELGAHIEYVETENRLPIRIKGAVLKGGSVQIDASVSSQFVSALMLITPLMENPLRLILEGSPVSLPYIKMTASLMTMAGVEPDFTPDGVYIPNTMYKATIEIIERDWSSASFWYAIAAMSAGWVTLNNISISKLQGDAFISQVGEQFGVITNMSDDVEGAIELSASPEQFSRLDFDMSGYPDLIPPLVVTAAALGIPFRFSGVKNLKYKESDRIEVLRTECLKLGWIISLENNEDVIYWDGEHVPIKEMPVIDPHGDHRIAMSFAPLTLFLPGIVIKDAEVVGKSYPDYWTHLQQTGFTIEEI